MLVAAAVGVVLSLAGCHARGVDAALAQNAGCTARVIVRFTTEPDGAWFASLGRAYSLELEPVEAITNEIRVYTLRGAGSDDCVAAIDRLRRDERVRSVDLDARRELHEEP